MGIIYKKSISSEYEKYFEKQDKFVENFKIYSLKNNETSLNNKLQNCHWETGNAGVPLSLIKNSKEVIIDHTDSHTLVIGPTGSKKSRLIAMPLVRILGNEKAKESMIISDPKAEIYNRTSEYLEKHGYSIFVLNLRSPMHGNCWNPLDIPYRFFCDGEIDRAYEFVNDISENIMQSDKSVDDPFWENSASSFFFGLVLLLLKYCKENNRGIDYVNIGNIVRLRNELFSGHDGKKNIKLWNYAKEDTIIESALIGTVNAPNDTRASILSVFDQKIRIFSMQPALLNTLSKNDINIDMLSKKPTAIFLIMPDEKTGYHSLVSLFIKQSYEYIIFKAQQEKGNNGFQVGKLHTRVNYILDEFSSLPTINDFPAMITASRSRNIRFTLIIQSKHQLIQRYKDETDTIQTNCNNWIFLTSREMKLLDEISALCGETSKNPSRPILSVSALQRLDKATGEVLILSGRFKPFISFLPDISEYDNEKFKPRVIKARKYNQLKLLDFKFIESKFELPVSKETMDLFSKPFDNNSLNTDEIIKQLEEKINDFENENL